MEKKMKGTRMIQRLRNTMKKMMRSISKKFKSKQRTPEMTL
jgi:DNA anti-recombination protein RmuC